MDSLVFFVFLQGLGLCEATDKHRSRGGEPKSREGEHRSTEGEPRSREGEHRSREGEPRSREGEHRRQRKRGQKSEQRGVSGASIFWMPPFKWKLLVDEFTFRKLSAVATLDDGHTYMVPFKSFTAVL